MGVDFVVGPGQRYEWTVHFTLETLARILDLDQRFWSVPSPLAGIDSSLLGEVR
jgi:hypothetical protein